VAPSATQHPPRARVRPHPLRMMRVEGSPLRSGSRPCASGESKREVQVMSSHSSIAADGTASEVTRSANRGYEYEIDEPRGEGWVIFAGVLIMLVGVMNTIYGI